MPGHFNLFHKGDGKLCFFLSGWAVFPPCLVAIYLFHPFFSHKYLFTKNSSPPPPQYSNGGPLSSPVAIILNNCRGGGGVKNITVLLLLFYLQESWACSTTMTFLPPDDCNPVIPQPFKSHGRTDKR